MNQNLEIYRSDSVYTMDPVHNVVSSTDVTDPKALFGLLYDYTTTLWESLNTADVGDPDFKKLCLSLHAQKANRDAMSQALIFMRTDRAPLVLIKMIADNSTL